MYLYAKLPLNSDDNVYIGGNDGFDIAKSTTELTIMGDKWVTLSESYAEHNTSGVSWKCDRYPEGDLYE